MTEANKATDQRLSPELKAKWVAALRSGTYQQAHGTLKDIEGRMCCLGVACDLIDPSKWATSPTAHDGINGFGWSGESPAYVTGPARALGLTTAEATGLAQLNDGKESARLRAHSFEEIADWIEANL